MKTIKTAIKFIRIIANSLTCQLGQFGLLLPKKMLKTRSINSMEQHYLGSNQGLAYHPQSNGQEEISNREIKNILEKTMGL